MLRPNASLDLIAGAESASQFLVLVFYFGFRVLRRVLVELWRLVVRQGSRRTMDSKQKIKQ